jgi:hypothetical protein
MSWGERSCGQGRPCGFNPTIESCNVRCPGYRWNGFTTPDSGEPVPLTKAQRRLIEKLGLKVQGKDED